MATLTADKAKTSIPRPAIGDAGNVKSVISTYTLAANPTAGDDLEMLWLPANARVIGGMLYADDVDTNATATIEMDVGWYANGVDTADPDGFLDSGALNGTAVTNYNTTGGTIIPLQETLILNGGKKFTVPTKIGITFVDAAATFAAGEITLRVDYIIDA